MKKKLIEHEQEIELEVSLENSDKTSCFELRLFFKCLQKIFFRLYEHIQCIWEVDSTLIFASVKKLWLYDMSIGLYCEFSYLSFLRQHRSDSAKIDNMQHTHHKVPNFKTYQTWIYNEYPALNILNTMRKHSNFVQNIGCYHGKGFKRGFLFGKSLKVEKCKSRKGEK